MLNRLLPLFAVSSVLAACATPTAWRADFEVDRLCALDGGVRIYEKVRLPANRFYPPGQYDAGMARDDQGVGDKRYGPEFSYKIENIDLMHTDEVHVYLHQIQLWRLADHKLLGESVQYTREGGGGLGDNNQCKGAAYGTTYERELIGKIFEKEQPK